MNDYKKAKKSLQRSGKLSREIGDPEYENFDRLVLTKHHDADYRRMLKSIPAKKKENNSYFEQNERYQGVAEFLQGDDQSYSGSYESSDHANANNQIKSALQELKQQRQAKSQLLNEHIKQLDYYDDYFYRIRKQTKTTANSQNQARSLHNQLDIYKQLIDIRYNQQRELDGLKRFPKRNFPIDNQLQQDNKQLYKSMLDNVDLLMKMYQKYGTKSYGIYCEDITVLDHIEEEINAGTDFCSAKLNIEAIYNRFSETTKLLEKEVEKDLIKWSQKTTLLNRTNSSAQYSSLIMQTPVGQAKKILTNWYRVSSKSQLKRGAFRILCEPENNIRQNSDSQIYDDLDLFTEIEKTYVNEIEDDNEFRVGDTRRYLKERDQRNQSKEKEVDRKASKNRKIRFNVHPKLMNFMPSTAANEVEARDYIVSNIFNCRAGLVQQIGKDSKEIYYIDM